MFKIMAKELRSGGWNVPTIQMINNRIDWIYEGYRTVEAETIEDARDFMDKNYDRVVDDIFGYKSQLSYKECHLVNKNQYSFIVHLKYIT